MPTNWPPAGVPSWPPAVLETTGFVAGDLRTLVLELLALGFTHEAPTNAERVAFFNQARCDHGHTVVGRMIISPNGTRYPFAICSDAGHRDVLVLWAPYYSGAGSRNYEW